MASSSSSLDGSSSFLCSLLVSVVTENSSSLFIYHAYLPSISAWSLLSWSTEISFSVFARCWSPTSNKGVLTLMDKDPWRQLSLFSNNNTYRVWSLTLPMALVPLHFVLTPLQLFDRWVIDMESFPKIFQLDLSDSRTELFAGSIHQLLLLVSTCTLPGLPRLLCGR